jgi:hypothetical protein
VEMYDRRNPPRAQSPFARARCYLVRRDLVDHVSRYYPAVIAPTDSAANPPPFSCLGGPLGHQVCAGCCHPLLGGGPSRRSLCESVSACLDPYPGGSHGAFTRFFPQDNGLPDIRTRSAHNIPHTLATSVWRLFEAAVIHSCSGSQICSPPRLLLPQHLSVPGSRGFYVHASFGLLPPRTVDMLTV